MQQWQLVGQELKRNKSHISRNRNTSVGDYPIQFSRYLPTITTSAIKTAWMKRRKRQQQLCRMEHTAMIILSTGCPGCKKHPPIIFGTFNGDIEFKAGLASLTKASSLFSLESEWSRMDPILNVLAPFVILWHVLWWLYDGAVIP